MGRCSRQKFNSKDMSKANKVVIIAEAGVNHNGDKEIAKSLIRAAADSKADYVKFQTFQTDKLVSTTASKAEYQLKGYASGDNSQYEMLKRLELPIAWHYELKDYAESHGIKFLSTGFDEESVNFLVELGVDLLKVPSGSVTDRPYLEHLATFNLKTYLSTGMCDMADISAAVEVLESAGLDKKLLTILHCNTEYPTPMCDVNLLAMQHIGSTLGVPVGYSDHTLGIEVSIAAVALGATVIEKHFTLDRTMHGPDHMASLEPNELKAMVQGIRNIEVATSGTGIKAPSSSESKNVTAARKSIHSRRNIVRGEIIKREDLIMRRPGDGISPMLINSVANSTAKVSIKEGEKIKWEQIEI